MMSSQDKSCDPCAGEGLQGGCGVQLWLFHFPVQDRGQ